MKFAAKKVKPLPNKDLQKKNMRKRTLFFTVLFVIGGIILYFYQAAEGSSPIQNILDRVLPYFDKYISDGSGKLSSEPEKRTLEMRGVETHQHVPVRKSGKSAAGQGTGRLEREKPVAEEALRRKENERLEAERLVAEEAVRIVVEKDNERLEAERLVGEEAARIAAIEEQKRLSDEEAVRIAVEKDNERLEAERLAAEEAARIAAIEEQKRLSDEEAARFAMDKENARLEAVRLSKEKDTDIAPTENVRLEGDELNEF